jgi:hypothetical protein
MNVAATVLKELGITEERAVREVALLNASQKAAEMSQEINAFEQKYKMSFDDFQRRLHSRSEEIFEEEDDYLAWKFAVEGRGFWREKIEQLKREG